jgi:Holliday junction resolvase
MAKTKGANAEREVIGLLQPIVDKVTAERGMPKVVLKRNLEQTRSGGYDIVGLEYLAIEVKRQETLNVKAWWEQTKAASGIGQEPILIYRQNQKKWRVVMFGYLPVGDRKVRCPVEVSLESFLVWFRLCFEKRIDHGLD